MQSNNFLSIYTNLEVIFSTCAFFRKLWKPCLGLVATSLFRLSALATRKSPLFCLNEKKFTEKWGMVGKSVYL